MIRHPCVKWLSFTLQTAGFETIEGANGVEGPIGPAKIAPVDLVITDLNMPEMDGITLIKELRNRPSFKFTPILLLTTESQDTKKQEGKAAGATGWMVKPFNPDQLLGDRQKSRQIAAIGGRKHYWGTLLCKLMSVVFALPFTSKPQSTSNTWRERCCNLRALLATPNFSTQSSAQRTASRAQVRPSVSMRLAGLPTF